MTRPLPTARGTIAVLLAAGLAAAAANASGLVEERLMAGDRAWESRAEGSRADRAAAPPIQDAITAYEAALEAEPAALEARWKLLRALFFLGEYVLDEREARLEVFVRGRAVAEEGLDRLAERLGGRKAMDRLSPDELVAAIDDRTDAARSYFWATVHWGLWGRTRGKLAAAREGVAGRVRDYAERVTALDGTIENGGGHRILGRLHTEAPRIPFVTGWIDRDVALTELEAARRAAPADLLTRVYLAELLLDHFPARSGEANELLRFVVASDPDPRFLVEERRAIADARHLLERR